MSARYVIRPKADQDLDDQAYYLALVASPVVGHFYAMIVRPGRVMMYDSYPDPNDEFVVVKTTLQMFGATLNRIAADQTIKRFFVVPTQGTLTPVASDWQNEIHPSSTGFQNIAQKFQTALATVFL